MRDKDDCETIYTATDLDKEMLGEELTDLLDLARGGAQHVTLLRSAGIVIDLAPLTNYQAVNGIARNRAKLLLGKGMGAGARFLVIPLSATTED